MTDLSLIQSRRVAVIGDYGFDGQGQGRAHALSLRDCGVEVVAGLPAERAEAVAAATDDGLPVLEPAEAVKAADVVSLLAGDDIVRRRFDADIGPNLADGDLLIFRSGVPVAYGLVAPRPAVDVGLVAPVAPGDVVRRQFVDGKGVPCLVAVETDASGQAWPLTMAYAAAIGGTRAGVIETTFAEQAAATLFGEQAVSLGGVPALVRAAFDVLVEAGCDPDVAYLACLHQLRDAVDRMVREGLAGARDGVRDSAAYGGLTRGRRVVGDAVRDELRRMLGEITDGLFASEWAAEDDAGRPIMTRMAGEDDRHPIEEAGRRLREHMPWLS